MGQRGLLGSLVIALVVGCSWTPHEPTQHALLKTHHVLRLHGDDTFTGPEREMVQEAADDVFIQTSGLLQVIVNFDFDFDRLGLDAWLTRTNLLVRTPKDASYVVSRERTGKVMLGMVVGVNLQDYDQTAPMQVHLIADRLTDRKVFIQVAEHEFYHAFGLNHVKDPHSVLYPEVFLQAPRTCISEADAAEICRVYGCWTGDLNTCT
jgi:hypothetical protein